MRIWDIHPCRLCRQHLLGEHRELHAIWQILIFGGGYRNHPETKRWKGKMGALFIRHDKLVAEMKARGYRHNSPLSIRYATGLRYQNVVVHTLKQQIHTLKVEKRCECELDGALEEGYCFPTIIKEKEKV